MARDVRQVIILICLGFLLGLNSSCFTQEMDFPVPGDWNQEVIENNYEDDYVDPSDMGTYQHGIQRNLRNSRPSPSTFEMKEKRVRRASYYKNRRRGDLTTDDTPGVKNDFQADGDNEQDALVEIVEDAFRSETSGEGSIGTVFLKRIIASLLAQMRVRNHNFGPKEAITIDLQAEISHEDLRTLNKFLASTQDTHSMFVGVDNIVSRMFHVVAPVPTIGFYEYFKEEIGFGMLWSMKFWLIVFSSFVIFLLSIILLIQIYATRSPVKILLYGVAIFFILSCVWVFAEFNEKSKATNAARLHQYQAIPKDCDFDNLGYKDSIGYFFRVKMFGFQDRCEEYHKEMLMDPFYKTSPVEAISETFSKLVFHPFGYIGTKLGDFFAGIVAAVPFWLKPFLLLLLFVFAFLGIFRFKITTPFLSLEPASLPQLEGSPAHAHAQQQQRIAANQQIIEKPPSAIVRAALKDASTSTEDLEDFILNSQNRHEAHSTPDGGQWRVYFALIQATCITFWNLLLQVLNFLLREVPAEPEDEELIPLVPEIPQDENNLEEPVPIIERPERNQQPNPDVIIPDPNVHYFDEEIWKDMPVPSRRRANSQVQGRSRDHEWVYVDESVKENLGTNSKSGSSSSSSENLNLGKSDSKKCTEENVLRNRRIERGGGDCGSMEDHPGPSRNRDMNKTL